VLLLVLSISMDALTTLFTKSKVKTGFAAVLATLKHN